MRHTHTYAATGDSAELERWYGKSSGLSLLSVACVSHELHARKKLVKYDEQTGSELSTALFSPVHSTLTSRIPTHHTLLVKPI